jgi:hypothetical protein
MPYRTNKINLLEETDTWLRSGIKTTPPVASCKSIWFPWQRSAANTVKIMDSRSLYWGRLWYMDRCLVTVHRVWILWLHVNPSPIAAVLSFFCQVYYLGKRSEFSVLLRGSSVSKRQATSWTIGSVFRFPVGTGNFSLHYRGRMNLGPTQPPVQWLTGVLPWG